MRIPYHLLRTSTFRSEPLLAAMAAIAIGMFVGTWVLGPLATRTSEPAAPQTRERVSFDAMLSRPDPSPYRAATPAFDNSNAPNYAAMAKQRAQAGLGDDIADDGSASQQQPGFFSSRRANYPTYDRHRVY